MKTRYVLGAYYFLFFALVSDYVIAIPKHFEHIGFSSGEIGVIFASMPIARFLIPFIYLKKSITQREYIFSLIISALSPCLLLSHDFYIVLVSFFLMGGGFSIVFPYIEALAIKKMKENYGKSRLFGSIGFMTIGILYAYVQINPIFLFIFLALSLSVVGLFFINDTTITPSMETLDFKQYWWFWVMLLLVEISFGGYYDFFTIYNVHHGMSKESVGWIWTIGSIAEVFIFMMQYKFISMIPPMIWVKFSVLVTTFRWLLLYIFPGNLDIVFFVQLLQAISFAIFHTANLLFIHMIYKNKALAQQFYAGVAYGIAEFLGSVIAGILYGRYLFLYESLFAFMGFIILVYGLKRQKMRETFD